MKKGGELVAFLKFLEKDKKKKKEELAPPSLPQLPPLKEEERVLHMKKPLPPLPPFEAKAGLPEKVEKPLFEISSPKGAPPAPPAGPLFPEIKEEAPADLPAFPKIGKKKIIPLKVIEEVEEEEFRAEKKELHELKKRLPKPTFIEINDFKEVLEFIGQIRNELKDGDAVLFKLNEIKNMQDKKYESWKSVMRDLQRKFIYVEKTLFETKYVR
ncbi:MAG: hypothetical protein KAT43_04200 [Nanoarchaeota archaeon]|nr:hypothetical protein [Nanoarchaeota archaeon]